MNICKTPSDLNQIIHEIPVWWHVCGIVLISALFQLHQATRHVQILAVCFIRLPGVFLHEIAHLLTGIFLRAEPVGFSLLPKRRFDGRWTLGSVEFRRISPFNAVPIALAPLGLVPLAVYIYGSWFQWFTLNLTNVLFLYSAVFLLVSNSLPSRQDLRIACNWKSLLLYGCIGMMAVYLLFDNP